MPKPALGKVAVGDRLLVLRPQNRFRDNDPIPVTVVKVGRVWVDLATEGNLSYRMRLDTQNEGSKYSQQNRFVTPAQHEWEQQIEGARSVLRDAKVNPGFGSPWHSDESRLLALAEFIRTYDETRPA
jgi:hypothetical protein